jgi:hypothetical protein
VSLLLVQPAAGAPQQQQQLVPLLQVWQQAEQVPVPAAAAAVSASCLVLLPLPAAQAFLPASEEA